MCACRACACAANAHQCGHGAPGHTIAKLKHVVRAHTQHPVWRAALRSPCETTKLMRCQYVWAGLHQARMGSIPAAWPDSPLTSTGPQFSCDLSPWPLWCCHHLMADLRGMPGPTEKIPGQMPMMHTIRRGLRALPANFEIFKASFQRGPKLENCTSGRPCPGSMPKPYPFWASDSPLWRNLFEQKSMFKRNRFFRCDMGLMRQCGYP